jgi:hypothetical protein
VTAFQFPFFKKKKKKKKLCYYFFPAGQGKILTNKMNGAGINF